MTQKPGHELVGSSGDNSKRTPKALYNFLDTRYRFSYDAFASHENHLAPVYSTVDGTFGGPVLPPPPQPYATGLTRSWGNHRVFMNPPYGRGIFAECLQKAYEERNKAAVIVGLIKWDTSTAAARFVRTFCDVWEIGRVRYEGEPSAATFASAIIFPRPDNKMIPLR